jgi:hypothetical protein
VFMTRSLYNTIFEGIIDYLSWFPRSRFPGSYLFVCQYPALLVPRVQSSLHAHMQEFLFTIEQLSLYISYLQPHGDRLPSPS